MVNVSRVLTVGKTFLAEWAGSLGSQAMLAVEDGPEVVKDAAREGARG